MYAKIENDALIYPQASEFRGVPNYATNEPCMRRHGYLPLVGTHEEREGYSATPSAWHVVQQSATRIEPRQHTVEDYETDEETGERRKVGEHTEMVDTEITVDTSYIQVDEWSYTELPPPPEPPQPSEEVRQATAAIINRIAELVLNYDAVEDAKELDNFNIENLLALAQAKNVKPEDMALLKEDLVLLKTDLEGKMDATWYQIWNGWLKGAIAEALRNMEEALRWSQAENEANPQDE